MIATDRVAPFPDCSALHGYHCATSSLAEISGFCGRPLSEEMLLTHGAAMGSV
jgi:hypothetical protein